MKAKSESHTCPVMLVCLYYYYFNDNNVSTIATDLSRMVICRHGICHNGFVSLNVHGYCDVMGHCYYEPTSKPFPCNGTACLFM